MCWYGSILITHQQRAINIVLICQVSQACFTPTLHQNSYINMPDVYKKSLSSHFTFDFLATVQTKSNLTRDDQLLSLWSPHGETQICRERHSVPLESSIFFTIVIGPSLHITMNLHQALSQSYFYLYKDSSLLSSNSTYQPTMPLKYLPLTSASNANICLPHSLDVSLQIFQPCQLPSYQKQTQTHVPTS